MSDVADFLGGGTKRFPKTIAWDQRPVGSSVGGIIIDEPIMTQQTDMQTKKPKFFQPDENGHSEPMMQMMLIIQSDEVNPAVQDDGKRTLAIRGGFKYESSKKALVEELQRNGLTVPRTGDYFKLTRLDNVKGQRTHQFAGHYVKVEDFTPEMKSLASGAPVKKAPAKKAAASSTWEE